MDRSSKLDDDLQQIYNIVIGQCTPGMEQSLAAIPEFEIVKEDASSVDLLKLIERICYNYQPHEYPPLGHGKPSTNCQEPFNLP